MHNQLAPIGVALLAQSGRIVFRFIGRTLAMLAS
jgi:hypothetical protein